MPDLSVDPRNPWKVKTTSVQFENPWFSVIDHDVINPKGNEGRYTYVAFKKRAVAVVPLDQDGCTWLVGQYRFPTRTYEWEVAEGGAELNESPLHCAQRELQEETGLIASRWTEIMTAQLSNCITDEWSHTFLAQDISFTEASPEETEELVVRRLPLQEAVAMVMRGEIRDCLSVASLLKVHVMLQEKLIEP